MKVVYKYFLQPGSCSVAMPHGATLLSSAVQNGQFCLWALIDPNEPRTVTHQFYVVGTGHPMHLPPAMEFFATIFSPQAEYVFHVFHIVV